MRANVALELLRYVYVYVSCLYAALCGFRYFYFFYFAQEYRIVENDCIHECYARHTYIRPWQS